MKDKILDAPFEEVPKLHIEDYLEDGENILWTGHPKLNLPFTYGFGIGVFIISAAIFTNPGSMWVLGKWGYFAAIPFTLILHVILTIRKNEKKKKTIYAITEKRVFFQFTKNLKKEIHYIPFTQINDVMVTENILYQKFNSDYGVVFLMVKNPASIPFTTYDFEVGERRHQPTLELIEKPEEIADLIRSGIKNKTLNS